jgi:hypothetical protein
MTQVEPSNRPKAQHLLDRKVFLPMKKNINLELHNKNRYNYIDMDPIRNCILVKDTEDNEKM